MVTVQQIHNAFYKEVCESVTPEQQKALEVAGLNVVPPAIYSKTFPLHKIIHINQILLLCEKYGLLFTETRNFSGVIPNKNIEELQKFVSQYNYVHLRTEAKCPLFGKYIEAENVLFVKQSDKHSIKYEYEESAYQWHIVAPKNMVVTEEIRKNNMVYKSDPIIIGMLRPEIWRSARWGVIVTAWGNEASDENVVNEKMN